MRDAQELMNRWKVLVVFYSRTDTTRKVAKTLANHLASDVEEVIDTVDRHGLRGRLRAGRDAKTKRLTTIRDVRHDPSQYDFVIIGTPIWNHAMSTPIRTYLTHYGDRVHDAAFFTTQDGFRNYALSEMRQLCANASWLHLQLMRKDVEANRHTGDIQQFVETVRTRLRPSECVGAGQRGRQTIDCVDVDRVEG